MKELFKYKIKELLNRATKLQGIAENEDKVYWLGQVNILKVILSFIDSMQEEPVSEGLEQAIDTYLATYWGGEKEKQDWPFLKKMAIYFANWRKQQDKKWLADNHKRIFNNGYEEGFEAGRDDMEEQMMRGAIETSVCAKLDGIHIDVLPKQLNGYRFGDRVKVLIIKCD